MPDIPSASNKTVFCSKVVISDEANNYVAGKNLRMSWSYAALQETVIGSNDPIIGTGEFRGTIEFEFICSTDTDLHDWVTPSSGQIQTKSLTIKEVDVQGTPKTRTWTVSAFFNEYEETFREDQFVRGRLRGVLTTEPSETVA